MNIAWCKDLAETVEALMTTVALIGGGAWTYHRFIRHRLFHPKAELNHEIQWEPLSDNKYIVQVVLTVFNRGDVLLPICEIWTKLYQVSPPTTSIQERLNDGDDPEVDGAEFAWPALGLKEINHDRGVAEIEPGESEKLLFEFLVDKEIKAIKVYSYFQNTIKTKKLKREIGWVQSTLINLNKE